VHTDKEISIDHSTSFKYVAVYKYQTVLEILTLGKRNNMNKRYINELLYGIHLSLCVSTGPCVVKNMLAMYLNGILGTGIARIFLNLHKRMWCIWCSCGTVALLVLGQFSDICAYSSQISENWSRTIRATVPQLYLVVLQIPNYDMTLNLLYRSHEYHFLQ
jgi:hypothetical protein